MPPLPKPLPRAFFDRPTVEVAQDLLGRQLCRRVGDQVLLARVVETEAYVGGEDLACHASRGVTKRTEVMFGPPGHAYVYLIYGMHHCLNVVTEKVGVGSAVLLRALEPIAHFPLGSRTDGPARLTKALSIDRSHNRLDLTLGEEIWLGGGEGPLSRSTIESGPRIGVAYAGEWAKKPWRFWIADNIHVSVRPRRSSRRSPRGSPRPR